MSKVVPSPRAKLAVPALLLAACLQGCISCPPVPELATLPGRDFATPERAFDYLREAILRGEDDDSYAYHEFRCFSELVKRERRIAREDYFLVRKDVLASLRERIGDPARVRVERTRRLAPDRAELEIAGGGRVARVLAVLESGYEVRFRDRGVDDVYGEFVAPRQGLDIRDSALHLRFAIEEALERNPGLTVDDVYEAKYLSEWKFYSVDDADLVDDIGRRVEEKRREAERKAAEEKSKGP
jgi:hypothetical protein